MILEENSCSDPLLHPSCEAGGDGDDELDDVLEVMEQRPIGSRQGSSLERKQWAGWQKGFMAAVILLALIAWAPSSSQQHHSHEIEAKEELTELTELGSSLEELEELTELGSSLEELEEWEEDELVESHIECPPSYDQSYPIDDLATLHYSLVELPDTNESALQACLQVGDEGWVALAFSLDGLMIGSDAVIGLPDESDPQLAVSKYNLDGNTHDLINRMPPANQTLLDTSLQQKGGRTVMKFTKILLEPGEVPILKQGANYFLHARGRYNRLAYHGNQRRVFMLDLSHSHPLYTSAPTPSHHHSHQHSHQPTTLQTITNAPTLSITTTNAPTISSTVTSEPTISSTVTTAPTISSTVTSEPTITATNFNDCTAEFCELQLSPDYKQRYRINVPPHASPDEECTGCSITMELIYEGEAWLGLALSTTGQMIGSEAILGIPDEGNIPRKYYLVRKDANSILPMPDHKQTLINASIDIDNGRTIMKFTKLLQETGEIKIILGMNTFIWAHGDNGMTALQYHGNNKDAYSLDLSIDHVDNSPTYFPTISLSPTVSSASSFPTISAPPSTSGGTHPDTRRLTSPPTLSSPPTYPPAPQSTVCPTTFQHSMMLSETTQFFYQILPDQPSQPPLLCGRLEYQGTGWIALAISPNGKMIQSEAIIGLPDENTVLKYKLTGYAVSLIHPMEHQTLVDATIVQDNDGVGKTILTFGKLLQETNELPISAHGTNTFLYAVGQQNHLEYHGSSRSSFQIDFSNAIASPMPTPLLTNSPTKHPTSSPNNNSPNSSTTASPNASPNPPVPVPIPVPNPSKGGSSSSSSSGSTSSQHSKTPMIPIKYWIFFGKVALLVLATVIHYKFSENSAMFVAAHVIIYTLLSLIVLIYAYYE